MTWFEAGDRVLVKVGTEILGTRLTIPADCRGVVTHANEFTIYVKLDWKIGGENLWYFDLDQLDTLPLAEQDILKTRDGLQNLVNSLASASPSTPSGWRRRLRRGR